MTPDNPKRRSARTAAALCVVATTLAGAGMAAIGVRYSPIDLLQAQPPAPGAAADYSWRGPQAPTEPEPVTIARLTPADRVLDAVVADGAVAGYSATEPARRTLVASPLSNLCPTDSAAPGAFAAVTRRVPAEGVTVTAEAYPAGAAAAALEASYDAVLSCTAASIVGSATSSGAGFAASGSVSGASVSWRTWARGDVIVRVSSSGGSSALLSVADTVDQVVTAALEGVCVNTASTAADWSRNPYSSVYAPFGKPVTVAAPAPTDPADPTADEAGAPAADTSTDTSDGMPEPFSLPSPEQVEELALPVLPAGWAPGDPLVPLDEAPRTSAPVLVDPSAIPPVAPGSPPQQPSEPTAAAVSATAREMLADVNGPGCGWDFARGTAPAFDPEAGLKQTRASVLEAFALLTTSAADRQAAVLDHHLAVDAWKDSHLEWTSQREIELAREVAQTEWDAAVTAYEAAVADYQAAYELGLQPPTEEPTPEITPDPTPTPTPTETPTTEPTPTVPTPTAPPTEGTIP